MVAEVLGALFLAVMVRRTAMRTHKDTGGSLEVVLVPPIGRVILYAIAGLVLTRSVLTIVCMVGVAFVVSLVDTLAGKPWEDGYSRSKVNEISAEAWRQVNRESN